MTNILTLGKYKFDLRKRTLIMGVLNRTPDSFSDGGKFFSEKKALFHIKQMLKDGADIIDIGGESARPGADEISIEEEIKRVIPIVKKISGGINAPISVDTRHAEVAEAALKAGASIINDISGLKNDPDMANIISRYKRSVVLMHMRGIPKTMQKNTKYKSLIKDIIRDLRDSIKIAKRAGIKDDKIIIDPGIGFAKTAEQNLEIIKNLREFEILKKPILIGTSRKSFIGKILDKLPSDRIFGTVASSVASVLNGADIVRVHDVKEVCDAIKITDAIIRA